MKLERYRGYKFTLRTTLSVTECRALLVSEFYAHGHWRHALSDKRLLGRTGEESFDIFFSDYFTPTGYTAKLDNSRKRDPILSRDEVARVCRICFKSGNGTTTLIGSYSYRIGELRLLGRFTTLGCMTFVGLILLIFGAIALFQRNGEFWLAPIGVVPLLLAFAMLRDSRDESFPRERDYIKRYLERILAVEDAKARKQLTEQQGAAQRTTAL